ncbi:hypothetical protein VU08_08600 [Desulfobulbus sp. F5]|nr:hypothetical protein [Desulfobulbus sp. F5]
MEKQNDHIEMFELLGGEQNVLAALKWGLENGFEIDKKIDITDLKIKNNSILLYYKTKIYNKLSVYSDFALIIGYVHGFLESDFKKKRIFNIGVNALCGNGHEIYIISPIESAKACAEGNAIYWLNNSLTNENFSIPKEAYLLVEGKSEIALFPKIFNSIGFNIDKFSVKLFPYSEHNLKTLLSVLHVKNDIFFLVCDRDKEKEIAMLEASGLLNNNYHILKNGELEDYVDSDALIEILKSFTPDIKITKEYINEKLLQGIGTSKVISKYYHENDIKNKPSKPIFAEKIGEYWVKKGVPMEFTEIMEKILNYIETQTVLFN